MKNIQWFWLLLIIIPASCKRTDPTDGSITGKTIKSIRESYQGKNTTYFLSYNSLAQLTTYESEDKKFGAQYRYENNKPNWICFKVDTVTYELALNYNRDDVLENSTLKITWASGKVKEEPVVVTRMNGEVKMSFFNGLYSFLIKNENVINASFNAWYFKRKITITYGVNQGPTFGTNVMLPKGELNDPFQPSSGLYTTLFHMILSVFSKNNVISINSDLYLRSFQYKSDDDGRITTVTIKAAKKTDEGLLELDSKLITYHY